MRNLASNIVGSEDVRVPDIFVALHAPTRWVDGLLNKQIAPFTSKGTVKRTNIRNFYYDDIWRLRLPEVHLYIRENRAARKQRYETHVRFNKEMTIVCSFDLETFLDWNELLICKDSHVAFVFDLCKKCLHRFQETHPTWAPTALELYAKDTPR